MEIQESAFCRLLVVCCRDDYIKEANKQLEGKTVYKDINFKETILSDFITEKELKYL